MTVIAYDGKTLASDKQAILNGIKFRVTKIRKMPNGAVLGAVGDTSLCLALMEWYENEGRVEDYPEMSDDRHATLIVISDGRVFQYESLPIPIELEEPTYAWGSGRELALGAMAMGADACLAVEIASVLHTDCGMGITALDTI